MTSPFVGHVKRCASEESCCVYGRNFPNPATRLEQAFGVPEW